MFWESFMKYCQAAGKTPNAVAKELNIPSGSITAWKGGVSPRNSTVKKIADYFNVSIGDFLDEKTASPTADGLSEYDIKALAWFHSLSPEKRKAILSLADGPEELAELPDRE